MSKKLEETPRENGVDKKVLLAWNENRILQFTPTYAPNPKKPSQDPDDVASVMLVPGNNSLDLSLWEKLSSAKGGKPHPIVEKLKTDRRGRISLVVREAPPVAKEFENENRAPEVAGMEESEARAWIGDCWNHKLLKRMQEQESRPSVSAYLTNQIQDLKDQKVRNEDAA